MREGPRQRPVHESARSRSRMIKFTFSILRDFVSPSRLPPTGGRRLGDEGAMGSFTMTHCSSRASRWISLLERL